MNIGVAIAFAIYYLLDEDPSHLNFEELKRVVSAYLGDEITGIELEIALHGNKDLIDLGLQGIRLTQKIN